MQDAGMQPNTLCREDIWRVNVNDCCHTQYSDNFHLLYGSDRAILFCSAVTHYPAAPVVAAPHQGKEEWLRLHHGSDSAAYSVTCQLSGHMPAGNSGF